MSHSPITRGLAADLAQQLQGLDTRFLTAIVNGQVDIALVVREELAARGCDVSGRWVGFAEASTALGL